MCLLLRTLFIPVLLTSWLGGSGLASAAPYGVRDDGKFFKPETVARANDQIERMQKTYHKDLLIETYASYKDIDVTEASKASFKNRDKEERDKAFNAWAIERARKQKVNGIYILICREPGHLQIEVGNETQKRAFTASDRHKLSQLLLAKFREKQYDEGLDEAVDFVRTTLRHNLAGSEQSSRPVQPTGGGGGGTNLLHWLLIGGAVLLGIWLLTGLFRGLSGGMGGGVGGGGGGFLSSMLGGLFGAAAGMWIYDSFFRGGGSSWGGDPTSDSSGPEASAPDTSYSGEGGDFGNDGGAGGDFGGGDFGGGDFGGGDFGGGGGDF